MKKLVQTAIRLLAAISIGGLVAGASVAAENSSAQEDFGVLVMAHGGTEAWNRAVEDAVGDLEVDAPIEIAFGMADAASLEESVSRLESAGARRIAVVRMFVGGASWYERTRQILGLEAGAPERPSGQDEGASAHSGHGASGHGASSDGGHAPGFWRIESQASFILSEEGLSEAVEMDQILLDRARALSRVPSEEDVLIVAHGPGDDDENLLWIEAIDSRAELLRGALGFRRVEVMTLREDWSGKREPAEKAIREFVERSRGEQGRALVIPFRLQGFGPYAEVLDGLVYEADGVGLLPHPAVTVWIDRQIAELRSDRFEPRLD